MESNENLNLSEEQKITQVPYESATDVCKDLGAVVPINLANEQTTFNRFLKTEIDVANYVMKKLHYKSVDEVCKAFVREQIDAIATAIWNFESKNFGLIVSDQTGLGKGRIVAGILRYVYLELNKEQGRNIVPVFVTEKVTLLTDIYRDLYDIGFDAGVPMYKKKQRIEIDIEDFTDEKIIKIIKADIKKADKSENGELRVDYEFPEDLEDKMEIFSEEYEDNLAELIELYRQDIVQNGENEEDSYEKVDADTYNKEVEEARKNGRILFKPFTPFPVQIKDKSGNIIYEMTEEENKKVFSAQKLPKEYGCLMMMYSTIRITTDRKTGQLSDKFKLIQKVCNNTIMVLDESHNASGKSNTYVTMTNLIRSSLNTMYVSATWAKRPDNMPLYGLDTSIKEAMLPQNALVNAFENGGLSLQEAVSSYLVRIGQLLRREKLIDADVDYYVEDANSPTGQSQIATLDRVSQVWSAIIKFEEKSKSAFRQALKNNRITKEENEDELKKYTFQGKAARRTFEMFNYFLLSLKLNQCIIEAKRQLNSGRKVVIAIANTLESAFTNMKQDYIQNIGYNVGDRITNDFSLVLGYLASGLAKFKYKGTVILDNGSEEDFEQSFNVLTISDDELFVKSQNNPIFRVALTFKRAIIPQLQDLIENVLSTPINLPLAPIDIIKQTLTLDGFKTEEITGRTKFLEFSESDDGLLQTDAGFLRKREKIDKVDIINGFNGNDIDCLIINQSGSTGISMHAVPTTKQGKIVPPVNVIPQVPPINLKPTNEVKQRAMIILQMELDINKEVQKLGRINRTGQVFIPVYRYLTSAIPSEARLNAMMQKKLKSLMANTAGSQEQGEETFNSDDFFSNVCVDPFNKTIKDLRYPSEFEVSNWKEIYGVTKMFYFYEYEQQREFWSVLSNNLKAHIADLKAKGQYVGAITFKDYFAEQTNVIPFIIGDNNAKTEFGSHVYAEQSNCQVFDTKNTESDLRKSILNNLSIVQRGGEKNNYNNVEDYFKANEITTQNLIDNYYKTDIAPDIEKWELAKSTFTEQLNAQKEIAERVKNLPEIIKIDEKLTEKTAKRDENNGLILSLMNESKFQEAQKATIENQQINKELEELTKKRNELLGGMTFEEMSRVANRITLEIQYVEGKIEDANKRIDNLKNDEQEQKDLRDSFLYYVKNIGQIFEIEIYDETTENVYDEDGDFTGEYKYVYQLSKKEKYVLVSARFNQNQNYYFTQGQVELLFKDVISDFKTNLYTLRTDFTEKELNKGKKPTEILGEPQGSYIDVWDMYIKGINTGRTQSKVFLSGNLLRAMAFRENIGFGGLITKYNTNDNRLKISLEMDSESAKRMETRFAENRTYPIITSLTPDNIINLILPLITLRKGYNIQFGIATQLLFDNSSTIFFEIIPHEDFAEELFNYSRELDEIVEKELENLGIDEYSDEYELLGEQKITKYLITYIQNNKYKFRYVISSDSSNPIKFFDDLLTQIGSENNNEIADVEYDEAPYNCGNDVENTNKNHNVILYSKNGNYPSMKKVAFISPQNKRREKRYKYEDWANNFKDIIISSQKVLENLHILKGKRGATKEFFTAQFNVAMTFESLIGMLDFLAKGNRILLFSNTINDILALSPEQYVFGTESNAVGIIDMSHQKEEIETIGDKKIETIDDIINEFVKLFN